MEEAMNLSGITNVPTANSNATLELVDEKKEGAETSEVVNNMVTNDANLPLGNQVINQVPSPAEPNSAVVSVNDAVEKPLNEVVSLVEPPVMRPPSPVNVAPHSLETPAVSSPLNDLKDVSQAELVSPVEPILSTDSQPSESPVEPILNKDSQPSESPVVELSANLETEQASTTTEMDEVAAMGKELFENASRNKSENLFSNMDFGPLKKFIDDDDITDISYSNGGQLWLKSLSKGVYRSDEQNINDALVEKIAFQCSNAMGKTFNMAHPFLDSESTELRMNFVHDSIARNGIAAVFRKTPAKIRLKKEKLLEEEYITLSVHDFLIKAVQGHCNIIVSGETGSGKTELVKYLASHTAYNEKLITIEDTLELHLDRIFPERDIVAMKTNNIASYSDVLVTCMRQNPKWILLSEVRSAEAVTAVRNSISSGHNILSTIHADKAENIPQRMYSLLESNIDVEQFLTTIHRYVHLGVYVRGRFDPRVNRFVREIGEVTEFYVDENNVAKSNTIYRKNIAGTESYHALSKNLLEYLEGQGVDISELRNFAQEAPAEFSEVQVDTIN